MYLSICTKYRISRLPIQTLQLQHLPPRPSPPRSPWPRLERPPQRRSPSPARPRVRTARKDTRTASARPRHPMTTKQWRVKKKQNYIPSSESVLFPSCRTHHFHVYSDGTSSWIWRETHWTKIKLPCSPVSIIFTVVHNQTWRPYFLPELRLLWYLLNLQHECSVLISFNLKCVDYVLASAWVGPNHPTFHPSLTVPSVSSRRRHSGRPHHRLHTRWGRLPQSASMFTLLIFHLRLLWSAHLLSLSFLFFILSPLL